MNYTQHFESVKRPDDSRFFTLRETAPESLSNFIRFVHTSEQFDCFPNDWIYAIVYHAIDELQKDEMDDINFDADPYAFWLKKWALEPFADYFIDWALDHYKGIINGYIELLEMAQSEAKKTIYIMVEQFLREESEKNRAERHRPTEKDI